MSGSIKPSDVVAPSPAVAEATIRIVSDLVALRRKEGIASSQIEAMAMHNAAIAVLRLDIGVVGVREMLAITAAENDRIGDRDEKKRRKR